MEIKKILEENLEQFVSILRELDEDERILQHKIDIMKDEKYAVEMRRRAIHKDMQELEEYLADREETDD